MLSNGVEGGQVGCAHRKCSLLGATNTLYNNLRTCFQTEIHIKIGYYMYKVRYFWKEL